MAITPEQLAKNGTEHAEQTALFQWAALNVGKYPPLKRLYAVPNGFYSSAAQKGKMKAEGLRNGVPDVMLPWPRTNTLVCYHGLYIEMKIEKYRNHKNGGCSDDQVEWLIYLGSVAYKTAVCYNWIEARDEIIKYLNGV